MFSAFSDKIMALYQKYLRSFVEKNIVFVKDSSHFTSSIIYQDWKLCRLTSRNSTVFHRDLLEQNNCI